MVYKKNSGVTAPRMPRCGPEGSKEAQESKGSKLFRNDETLKKFQFFITFMDLFYETMI